MALIDSNKFIAHLVWSGIVDKATCGELKEAIDLCTVKDVYTKDDMVSMFTELNLEIDEMFAREINYTVDKIQDLIQSKINSLKEDNDRNDD